MNPFNGNLTRSDSAQPIYKDSAAPIAQRVEDLLARMTLEEKIGQMTQVEKIVSPQKLSGVFSLDQC